MTPAEQAIAAQALVDRLAAVVDGAPHDVVLVALLSMYRSTAIANPCCTASSADNAARVAASLMHRALEMRRAAAPHQPPKGDSTYVH